MDTHIAIPAKFGERWLLVAAISCTLQAARKGVETLCPFALSMAIALAFGVPAISYDPLSARSLFAFAGIWCTWRGTRGTQKKPVDGEHMLYGFLTTASNDEVKPVHAMAMPAILTTPEECDAWLSAEPAEAPKLQRPLPDELLTIVARGEREDPPPGVVPSAAEPTLL